MRGAESKMVILIAPYKEMKIIADSLIDRFDIPINTIVANLQEALEPARAAMIDGSIIVSRGGTAKLIRETFGVEVIEIGISQYELLRVLQPLIHAKKKAAVIGFRSLTEQVEKMCTILDIPITCLPVDTETEVESRIQLIANQRIDVLIGDMITINAARGINTELHLIESDEYAVYEALSKAVLIAKKIRLQRESDIRIRAILNSVQEAILAVDKNGVVNQVNSKASELLGMSILNGTSIQSVINDKELIRIMEKGSEVTGKLEEINGRRFAVNLTPFVANSKVEGAVIVLQDVGRIQALENKVRKQLYAKGLTAKHTFSDIYTSSPSMQFCIDIARQYAQTDSNIVIYGETGTGKELLAQSIHNASAVRDGPFVAINCGALPASLLESELFGYAEGAFTGAMRGGKAGLFELAHNGTIFLDEINELDFQLQSKLL
ncbi:MAG: sigma 54-interacting transcriptional regulator, partial [Rectinemataceae bacterium]